MYDLIGDIHGHADELVRLLAALGYEPIYCLPRQERAPRNVEES